MIVADASAVAALLLAGPDADAVRVALRPHPELHVPEHFHVEVTWGYLDANGDRSTRRRTAG